MHSMVICCALLKSYRIASIFGSHNFSPSDLTDKRLLKYFLIFMSVDVVLLSVYTLLNFLEGGAYVRYIDDTLSKQNRCSSERFTSLSYYAMVAWQLGLLCLVYRYGSKTRSASSLFKETKCIYVGSQIGGIQFIAFGT